MKAVGLTDHGTFSGAIEFLKECRKNQIKPILGMETYQARDHKCKDSTCQRDNRKGNRHLNVIAKNYQGFQNLCALSQDASVEGYYYDARVDLELLEKYKEGLIITSACLSSVVNSNLLRDNYDKAKKSVALFKDIFKEDFYLEMMFHGIDAEAKILPDIQKLSKEMNVKIICTNDVHYADQVDAEFHEKLMCMSSGKTLKDPNRLRFPYDEFYFKSQEEMYKIFNHVPSYLMNTLEIAEKCDYNDLIFVDQGGEMRIPHFEIPKEFSSPHDYLDYLGRNGLKNINKHTSEIHVKRLEQELSDLRLIWDTKRYDFATYFLIVNDIIRFCKEQDIAVGIRGSGYGSILLKALNITEGVDPLEKSLLWERFLGFDDERFIGESDLGIKKKTEIVEEKNETAEENTNKDATEVMFDRYG